MQLYSTYGLYAAESDGTIDNDYRYGGKEFDTRNGLNIYDFGARTYAPDIARFWQPDPMSHDYHWLSPYSYCGGDPVNRVDPDGCDWVSRIVNGITEYYYDRDITSQALADSKYGNGVVTYIPDGQAITIGGVDFTFNNDLVENKHGTVSIGGKVQDNSRIIYGEDYTIFGTTDESCNAETLHNNYFGTSYTGPTNPLDYNGKYNYQYIPRNRSELGSRLHDKAYDAAKAAGPLDAFFNVSETVVRADARLLRYNLMNVYYSPSYYDKLRSLGTAVVFYEILLRKYPIYLGGKLYNKARSLF